MCGISDTDPATVGTVQSFQPKLVLTIDAVDGIPLDIKISEETRRSLENLVQKNTQITEAEDAFRSIEVGGSQGEMRPACVRFGRRSVAEQPSFQNRS